MLPPPRSRNKGAAAWLQKKRTPDVHPHHMVPEGDIRLLKLRSREDARIVDQGIQSSKGILRPLAQLLALVRFQDVRLLKYGFAAISRMVRTTASPLSTVRPLTTTFAPSAAKRRAISAPIPVVDPTTMATLSCNRPFVSFMASVTRFSRAIERSSPLPAQPPSKTHSHRPETGVRIGWRTLRTEACQLEDGGVIPLPLHAHARVLLWATAP